MLRFWLGLFCLCSAFYHVHGQINVQQRDPYAGDLNAILQASFFGPGISVTNAEFKGVDVQFGTFTGAQNDLGFNEGIVLSTGRVTDAVGQGDTASSVLQGSPNRVDRDADLEQLANFMTAELNRQSTTFTLERPENMQEAAILEFDVETRGKALDFTYVFSSDEYSDWINTRFIDIMGIFISGPGINGTYSRDAVNIATLPNSDLPICVSTTHGGNQNFGPFNEQFFVPTTTQNLAYGGSTVVLTNSINLSPCTVYHVKIAIADGTLPDKDSGLFLRKNGLSSTAIKSRLLPQSAVSFADSLYQEGCALVGIALELPPVNTVTSYTQTFASNSVANGADVNFNAGFTQRLNDRLDTLYYAINNDFVQEGIELAAFEIRNQDGCVVNENPMQFYIQDRETLAFLDPSTDTITFACANTTIGLSAQTNFENEVLFSWSVNVPDAQRNNAEVNVNPSLEEESFILSAIDSCTNDTVLKRFVLLKIESDPIDFKLSDDSVFVACSGEPYTPTFMLGGGTEPYSFSVQYPNQNFRDNVAPEVELNETSRYFLTVTDACGLTATDSVEIILEQQAPLSLALFSNEAFCLGDTLIVFFDIQGGTEPYTLFLNDQNISKDSVERILRQEEQLIFEVVDACGQSVVDEISIIPDALSASFELRYLNQEKILGVNLSEGADRFEWYVDNLFKSADVEPRFALDDVEVQVVELLAFSASGCVSSFTDSIQPFPRYYIPTAFTPDGDGLNDCFKPMGSRPDAYTIQVYDRWGGLVLESSDWDFCWDGRHPKSMDKLSGVYAFRIMVRINNLSKNFTGSITLLR